MKTIKRIASSLCAALCVLAFTLTSHAAVEITNVDGDGYSDLMVVAARFKLPRGFVRSTRFDGFEAPERNSEIVASLLRAPYDSIADNITEETLKMRGVNMLARADVLINGRRGILIKAQHPDGDAAWGKWILVLENGSGTLVVNGIFVSGDSETAVEMEAVMKSIIPYGTASEEQEQKQDQAQTSAHDDALSTVIGVMEGAR